MSDHQKPSDAAGSDEITSLIRLLHETQQRLQELGGSELDAVLHPDGHSYLLHQAQEKLVAGEARQRALAATQASILNALPAQVALIDQRGIILSVNEKWTQDAVHIGFCAPENIVGEDYVEICRLCGMEGAAKVAEGVLKVLSGAEKEFVHEYPGPNSREPRWYRLMINPMREGRIGGAVVTHLDVTDRKQAETTSQMRADMLDHIGQAVITTDISGKIIYANRHAEEIYGWSAPEMCGLDIMEVTVPQTTKEQAREIMICLGNDQSWSGEFLVQARSGRVFPAFVTDSPLYNGEGKMTGIIEISTDISIRKREEQERHESAQRFSGAFEQAPIGVALVSPDGHWLKVNRAVCLMLGYDQLELMKSSFQELTHPDDLPADLELYGKVLEGEIKSYQIEKRYIHADGHYVTGALTVSLVRDDQGQPLYFIAQIQDVSAQKQAETALLQSRQRLALATEAAHIGIWDWDVVADKLVWDAQMYALWGIREVAAWEKTLHPDDRKRAEEQLRAALEGTYDFHLEFRIIWPNGEVREIEAHADVQRSPDGTALRMVGVNWDITDRKKSERRMMEQAALLDMAPDAILVRDLQHRIIYCNQSAERLYGWTKEEAIGHSFIELLKVDMEKFAEADRAIATIGEWQGEMQKTTRNGMVVSLDSRWTLVHDSDGLPRAILVIDTDITERKKLEQQFLRSQRMESIGTLAGGIAHDLNNSLAPILMSIEILKLRFNDPASRELLANISSSAERGADMVRQLLSFARGVTGKRMEVVVSQLVQDVEKIVRDTFLKHIHVRTIVPADLWTVIGDPTQLHQVLLNLCVNARDAMPEGGTLSLSAENVNLAENYIGLNAEIKTGPYVVIQVEDSGTGMPPDVIEKIFDPFYTTKELGKGTGLGLSTSLGIVKSHGGFIRVYSEPGKGTTFRVHLPAQTEVSADARAVVEAEMPRGRGEMILVVDDEPSVRQITQQTLEAFGYRVLVASDGAEAVAIYANRSTEIAAVLTDMMMPGVDGVMTIQVLRRMNPTLPIIAASGLATDGQIARATHLGVKHFLAKPYTTGKMLKALREIFSAE